MGGVLVRRKVFHKVHQGVTPVYEGDKQIRFDAEKRNGQFFYTPSYKNGVWGAADGGL